MRDLAKVERTITTRLVLQERTPLSWEALRAEDRAPRIEPPVRYPALYQDFLRCVREQQ